MSSTEVLHSKYCICNEWWKKKSPGIFWRWHPALKKKSKTKNNKNQKPDLPLSPKLSPWPAGPSGHSPQPPGFVSHSGRCWGWHPWSGAEPPGPSAGPEPPPAQTPSYRSCREKKGRLGFCFSFLSPFKTTSRWKNLPAVLCAGRRWV